MKETIITVKGLGDYPKAAKEFVKFLEEGRLFAFYGKMGSGKTTFFKCLLKETGSEVDVASLSQGTYILQINNQFVKFIKK